MNPSSSQIEELRQRFNSQYATAPPSGEHIPLSPGDLQLAALQRVDICSDIDTVAYYLHSNYRLRHRTMHIKHLRVVKTAQRIDTLSTIALSYAHMREIVIATAAGYLIFF